MLLEARGFHRTRRLALVLSVLLIGSAVSLSANSARFNCTAAGQVFETVLETGSVFSVTLTWTKAAPDNDLALFDPVSGMILALGVGIAPRYEHVAIGGLPGLPVGILAIKESGPNGLCVLRWAGEPDGTLSDPAPPPPAAMRNLGSLNRLAATDPKYAAMKSAVDEYLRLKRPAE